MANPPPIPEDRPLTPQELALTRWLLEHGHPDAAGYLPQLAQARVVSRCPCGCASIDFAIGGVLPPAGAGMHILSDYVWQADDGAHCGVFVFSCGGLLAGLEVWSADGMGAVSSLPSVERLHPLAAAQSAEPGAAADGGARFVSGTSSSRCPAAAELGRSAREGLWMATHLDLSDTQIDILAELYAECDTTLDDLPYTDAFERLYSQFLARAGVSLDRHGVWRALSNARKASRTRRCSRRRDMVRFWDFKLSVPRRCRS